MVGIECEAGRGKGGGERDVGETGGGGEEEK